MDAIGIFLGVLTIPMALLSLASLPAGLALIGVGAWVPVLIGVAAFALCSLLARALEQLVIVVDDRAQRAAGARAYAVATIAGALPVAVLLAAQVASLLAVLHHAAGAPTPLAWLWGYGVATGPWTLWSQQVSRFRRTLLSIRAYAGHIALWLFSLAVLAWHAPPAVGVAAMMVPAVLPVTVGLLLALADRKAISDVRV